jgi:hypothetical protein
MKTHNNQPAMMIVILWRLKRRCTGVRANGGKLSHQGNNLNDKKIITNKIQLCLRRLPSDDGDRNNKPKIDGRR